MKVLVVCGPNMYQRQAALEKFVAGRKMETKFCSTFEELQLWLSQLDIEPRVRVVHLDQVKSRRKAQLVKFVRGGKLAYDTVFFTNQTKPVAYLKELCKLKNVVRVECPELKVYKGDVHRAVRHMATSMRLRIGSVEVQYLVDRFGGDQLAISNLLHVLKFYSEAPTIEDIELISAGRGESSVRELLDAWIDNRVSQCLRRLSLLRSKGVSSVFVAKSLARRLCYVWRIKELQKQNLSSVIISKRLGLNPYEAKFLQFTASKIREAELRIKVKQLLEFEQMLSMGVDEWLWLIFYLGLF